MKHKRIVLAALALIAFALPLPALAGKPTLFVEPVEVFNSPEIEAYAPGLKPMIAGRVEGEGYRVVSDEAAAQGAHWKLRTTITKLSNLYSVDAEVSPLVEGAGSVRTYETIDSPDALMGALETVMGRVRERLEKLVVALPKASAAAPVAAPAPVTPAPVAVPAPAPAPSVAPAPPVVTPTVRSAKPLSNYKVYARFEGTGKVLEIVDMEGDGSMELFVYLDEEVHVMRDDGTGVTLVWKAPLETDFKTLWVSTADLDGDSKLEVIAAGAMEAEAYSQAFKVENGALVPYGEKVYAFVRALDHPDLGRIVVGLKSKGGSEVFKSELYRWSFDGTEFIQGEQFELPSAVMPINIDWVKFAGNEGLNTLILDDYNKLRIYDENMKLELKLDDQSKGTKARYEGEMKSKRTEEPGDIWEVNAPSVFYEGLDGKTYAVVYDNISELGVISKRWASFNTGKLYSFSWDGMAYIPGDETPEFPGYFTAVAIGPAPGGGKRLYALLIKEEGMLMVDRKTVLAVFDL